jgi:hypothetical protein
MPTALDQPGTNTAMAATISNTPLALMINNRNGTGTCKGIIADMGLDCRNWPSLVKRKTQVVAILPREISPIPKVAKPKNGISRKARIKMMFRSHSFNSRHPLSQASPKKVRVLLARRSLRP